MRPRATVPVLALLAALALANLQESLVSSVFPDGPSERTPLVDQHSSEAFVPGRVLVRFKSWAAPGALLGRSGISSGLTGRLSPQLPVILPVTPGEEAQTIESLKRDPAVDYVELDYSARSESVPNSAPDPGGAWNLSKIRAPAAWASVGLSPAPTIAILDTGVDPSHPDLQGRILPGYDFANEDDDPSDDNGHGTHVAGIAAASINEAAGVAGISQESGIMPLKVLDAQEMGSVSSLARAIVWATDRGARIVNLSLGVPRSSHTLEEAVRYARDRGVLLIAAAGNSYNGPNAPIYPAAYPEVLAVAATTSADGHASYSSAGPYVDLAAPGGDPEGPEDSTPENWITSTYWTEGRSSYGRLSGTSQAAAHVAGVAALVMAANPNLTNDEVEGILEATALDLGAPGKDSVYGYGRIDAQAAVTAAKMTPGSRTPGSSAGAAIANVGAYRSYVPLAARGFPGTW